MATAIDVKAFRLFRRPAKRLAGVSSPEKPDAVLHFLRSTAGLSPIQVRHVVRCCPCCLFSDVRATLLPKLQLLSSLFRPYDGPSEALADLVAACAPSWSSPFFFRCPRLLAIDDDQVLRRNLDILRGHPDVDVPAIVYKAPFLLLKPDSLESVYLLAEKELGIDPSSKEFVDALHLCAPFPKEILLRKLGIVRSYGFNNEQLFTMFRRSPIFLQLTEEHIRKKLDFLVGTVGLTKALLGNTWLLLFSLDSRLVPRYQLLQSLQSRRLLRQKINVGKAFAINQQRFNKVYVEKFCNGEGSDLAQSYMKNLSEPTLALQH
ncbi:hypothetical protein B296_00026720 [Ensete ventricosum]|uniref:Uncharacterized protein n=1 Tax=Ensete ventricosum TaxID=4639 RepID=A0A426YKQ6_ENSVE|nr:hypothetical protein B296_00026720 [Ensete ventricosum]